MNDEGLRERLNGKDRALVERARQLLKPWRDFNATVPLTYKAENSGMWLWELSERIAAFAAEVAEEREGAFARTHGSETLSGVTTRIHDLENNVRQQSARVQRLVELLRVEHNAQAVTTNVRVRCPVCRWEGGPYET